MYIGEIINKYRVNHNLSLREFAEKTGLSHSYIAKLEKIYDEKTGDPYAISLKKLKNIVNGMGLNLEDVINTLEGNQKISEEEYPIYKGVSLEDIIDEDDEFEKIPLLGEVAAGVPIYMDDDLNDYITVDKKYIQSGYDYFCLTIRGDSMYPILMNKDIVLVRSQSTCNSNDIAIVSVDNETATAKYVYKHKDKLELRPANPNYIPLVFSKDEVNTRVRIVGVVTNLLDRKL